MSASFLDRGDGLHLAYAFTPASAAKADMPTLLFLPGYMSDMEGTKALHLESWARRTGHGMIRMDYSGCGASEGHFADGTISRWRDDVLAVIDAITPGPLLLIGSSMGGWLALLVALARPDRLHALILIAPAPDFTLWSVEKKLSPEQRTALEQDGQVKLPSAYGDPYLFTRALLEDGHSNQLMAAPIAIDVPVRILHGQQDDAVPWQLSLDIADRLASADVRVTFSKSGDHRLSGPEDLELLCQTVAELCHLRG